MHISLWYADQHKLVDHCISYKQYRELGGFVSKPLAPGDWTFRIRAESLGGRGNWTPHMSFFIEGAGKQQLVNLFVTMRYDTIRYDSVYLTCSKTLTDSQLSLPHRINKKIKCETKNKMMSMIGVSINSVIPVMYWWGLMKRGLFSNHRKPSRRQKGLYMIGITEFMLTRAKVWKLRVQTRSCLSLADWWQVRACCCCMLQRLPNSGCPRCSFRVKNFTPCEIYASGGGLLVGAHKCAALVLFYIVCMVFWLICFSRQNFKISNFFVFSIFR